MLSVSTSVGVVCCEELRLQPGEEERMKSGFLKEAAQAARKNVGPKPVETSLASHHQALDFHD
jgi:hypothetical protein